MSRSVLYASIVYALAGCAAVVAAEERSVAAREGVLLLNNGELIAGTIIPAGDRYDVHLKNGEISVRRADVALVCRDAMECYTHKRATIDSDRPEDHLALAEWCIKNRLLDAAEAELAAAKAVDAAHPKIRLVELRLSLAREKPRNDPAEKAAAKPGAQESLDSMAKTLPAGTMEQFTNTVQPLLLNYCAKGGCHAGRGQGGLHLERIHPKLAGRFSTQRNLRNVLVMIDRDNPAQSKLLQAPIKPHGPSAAPIFTDREQSQFKQLATWVFAVTGTRPTVAPPTLEERTAPLLQAVPGASGTQDAAKVIPASAAWPPQSIENPDQERPAHAPGGEADGAGIPASNGDRALTREQYEALGLDQAAAPKSRRGVAAKGEFVPKDPFDPEIFNRRYFGR